MITSNGVMGGSFDRPDEHTLNEAVDSGYEWKLGPGGYYRTKAGVVHPDDLDKLEEPLQKVIQCAYDDLLMRVDWLYGAGTALGFNLRYDFSSNKKDIYYKLGDTEKRGYNFANSIGHLFAPSIEAAISAGSPPTIFSPLRLAGPGTGGTAAILPSFTMVPTDESGKNITGAWDRLQASIRTGESVIEGSNTNFTFPKGSNDIKRVFGVEEKTFHKQVKSEILKQISRDSEYGKEFRKMGKNPDIGVDAQGNIVLRNVQTGETLSTNWQLKDFLP